jgi:pimeloyl-ACP methyl ester carboxylesterase
MGTTTITRSIHVDAPISEVFALVDDPVRRWSAYPTTLTISEVVLTPEGVGSTNRWRAAGGPIRIGGLTTRTEHVQDRRIVEWSSTGPTWAWTLEPAGVGTTLTLSLQYSSALPLVDRAVLAAMSIPARQTTSSTIEQWLAALKNRLEGGPAQPGAPTARPHHRPRRTGRFGNGIEYLALGDGPRTALWLEAGPGSKVPSEWETRLVGGSWSPLADAGFTVWILTRRRGMPAGHSIADMATDVAEAIDAEFGGRVDLVVGPSFGGLIAQYLAADHPDRVDRVVLAMSACRISLAIIDADRRLAEALSVGDRTRAGAALAEFLLPGNRARPLRTVLAPMMGLMYAGSDFTGQDPVIEARAEAEFDSREALPRIRVPVLLLAADRDLAFPKEVYEETARLIPDCTLVWYRGMGHLRAATSRRLPRDIVAFANATLTTAPPEPQRMPPRQPPPAA